MNLNTISAVGVSRYVSKSNLKARTFKAQSKGCNIFSPDPKLIDFVG